MLNEQQKQLVVNKCLEIAHAFDTNWRAVSEAVDVMIQDAGVPKMFEQTRKFDTKLSEREYGAEICANGYVFRFKYDPCQENKYNLNINWDGYWFGLYNKMGASNFVLETDCDYALDEGVKIMVRRRIDTEAEKLIKWRKSHDSSVFKPMAEGAAVAVNHLVKILTDAYNRALDLEKENDAALFAAFDIDRNDAGHATPKQYKVKVIEKK